MKRALLLCIAACSSPTAPSAPPAKTHAAAEAPMPPEVEAVVDIGRGPSYGCVVRSSGAVDCWGQPIGGPPNPRVRRIPGVVDAIEITDDGSCVLRKTGQLACLADDRLEFVTDEKHAGIATLGRGARGCFILKTGEAACGHWYELDNWEHYGVFPGINDAIEIASGSEFRVCVLRKTGELLCGEGSGYELPKLEPVTRLQNVRHVSFIQGSALACAVLDNAVDCFFKNTAPDPRAVPGVTDVSIMARPAHNSTDHHDYFAIVGGTIVNWLDYHEAKPFSELKNVVRIVNDCALTTTDEVYCWGSNLLGAIGQPTTIGRALRPPTPVVGAQHVVKLVVAGRDRYATTASGDVLMWGTRSAPQATKLAVPSAVGAWKDLVATEAGSPCLLADNGAVWCKREDDKELTRVVDGDAVSIAAESKTILVLRKDGTAVRLRTDHENPEYEPTQPAELPRGTTQLISATYEPCAIANERLYCSKNWERVLGVEAPSKVSTRSIYGCAIVGKDVRCWRDTYDKGVVALSDGPEIKGATDLSVSPDHICAVVANGRVKCWSYFRGDDALDILGTGAARIELSPREGDLSGCILMTDQTVRCFGQNANGELGDGSVRESTTPVKIHL